ncbi:FtsX-like permease family protein [Vagococcus bubulae]|uniref:ABC3 transporter permease C-terminal domain-containing protein n=1 Tax=Vagococcus bubulae TaxID=1977868 RepID=A0A429ZQF9_9ENTE|nr:FtsX-like permease family protein [Vagococcus bubulae]RST95879.1 hypothetical protein CBF36_01545 [Vagococcus bubulae]
MKKKKALWTSTFREIYQSKARFISILLIIMLGVGFYAGIKATGPDMLNTADTYYKDYKLMDTKLVSTIGLEDKDIELIKEDKTVKTVEPSYSLDVLTKENNHVLKLMSYESGKNELNKPVLVKGKLPEKDNEIALDTQVQDNQYYKIGDTLTIQLDDKKSVSQTSYKVVGFVNSPMYIDKVSRGYTTVGKGTIDYFGYIKEEVFTLPVYTEAYIKYVNTEKTASYSKAYNNYYDKDVKNLKNTLKNRPSEQLEAMKKEANESLAEAKTQITDGETQLTNGKKQLAEKEKELNDNKQLIEAAKQQGLPVDETQEKTLQEASNTLNEEKKKIEQEEQKLVESKEELAKNQQAIDDLKAPTYHYFSREDNPSYAEFQDNADRISSIATVFPVFFFMIAALISLTTMTRMVDEKRGEIGTLKALGYTNWEISQKYIVYSTTASIIGSLIGLAIGYHLFPTVIFDAYGSMYNLPSVIITYYSSYTIQSIIVALLCTLLASLLVLRVDLLSTPATLMRPKAPKPGKRILLERISWLWSKFSFNQKVTARNLFRYKQRMLMTVLGIAGCTAMILTGFGLKDSIGDIVNLQFNKIWHYDATVTINEDSTTQEKEDYEKIKADDSQIKTSLNLSQNNMTVVKKGYTSREVTVDVPEQEKKLSEFITFNDRKSGETYTLSNDGVIINEKLANFFDVKSGDELTIRDTDNKDVTVKVQEVVENYAMHFVYMTPSYFEKTFNKKPNYNVELLKFDKSLSDKQEDNLADKLMKSNYAANVSFTSQIGKTMDDTMSSLNIVVWVLIISAALLAFVVLYNLTNINISERIRELSTIKVLGFYDREVTMYVYRENNILTVLGILLGFVLGVLLHGYVLKTAEIDMMMFPTTIHPISYVYSALLTILFSFIVMLIMHRKLKHVDMIEALKSTE